MLTTFPLESPEILCQSHICYHWLSVSGISEIIHFGKIIHIPSWKRQIENFEHMRMKAPFYSLANLLIRLQNFERKMRLLMGKPEVTIWVWLWVETAPASACILCYCDKKICTTLKLIVSSYFLDVNDFFQGLPWSRLRWKSIFLCGKTIQATNSRI